MKRLLAILFALTLIFALAACADDASPASEPAPAPAAPAEDTPADDTPPAPSGDERFIVYLVTMDQMDMHWVAVDEGCRQAAGELGNIDYFWDAPTDGKNDVAQMEVINNAVANGADLILLASNGPDTQVATIQEAMSRGVRFIYVDSPANIDAYQTLATDNEAAGHTAGLEMIADLNNAGITEGSIGIVNVNPATTSTVLREAGFRAAFEGTGFEILETQYGEGQVALSQELAANYIIQGVVGIFGTNEGGTVGVGNAISESGGTVVGVGFDTSDAILQHIRNGDILATMAQNPFVMGFEGMKSAGIVLAGGTIAQPNFDTGVSVINAANVG